MLRRIELHQASTPVCPGFDASIWYSARVEERGSRRRRDEVECKGHGLISARRPATFARSHVIVFFVFQSVWRGGPTAAGPLLSIDGHEVVDTHTMVSLSLKIPSSAWQNINVTVRLSSQSPSCGRSANQVMYYVIATKHGSHNTYTPSRARTPRSWQIWSITR